MKKKLSSTESKYILIKQDYENKIKNQYNTNTTKNIKSFLKTDNNSQNSFNTKELNAIFQAVGGNKNLFYNIIKKLNINENKIDLYNSKILENQIELYKKQQKINIMKNNQLIEKIQELEKKNNNKNEEINKLKKELNILQKEHYDKLNDITDSNEDLDKDNVEKITSKRLNSKFSRISIDANKNKEDNS